MKELHTNDLSMNSGKLFREQMVENFKIIERNDSDIRRLLQEDHDDLSKQLTQINKRLDELMNGGAM
ncbi:hypothetical protein LMB39_05090 [Limosilactobacillus reuteri]|uniref:hypothetical protein n=1 Tax=Limosilactobacillus reuteri TaxID=1598 RepID=UPI001E39F352|nr:hypothetical protein [Limosilactobacillus reuteri]MCC4349187.1 hypothetical protein [Limosilactobacillus reuteri]MCC4374791.1 hypothetical protein [Limosilactobacillus reuteri]MCC4385295.1 hypothetical protein [Limosilactobacillus reuteri]